MKVIKHKIKLTIIKLNNKKLLNKNIQVKPKKFLLNKQYLNNNSKI